MLIRITREFKDGLATDVACQDQNGVGEIHRASLAIGDASVIEDLQHHVEHIGVGFLHLVEQDHGVGPSTNSFRELSTGLIAHIARGCSDQTAHRVLLHVLRHVDAHHGVVAIE